MSILSGGLSLGKAGDLASCLFMPFPFPLACFCLFFNRSEEKVQKLRQDVGRSATDIAW